jgi:hypothetical protein
MAQIPKAGEVSKDPKHLYDGSRLTRAGPNIKNILK